MLEDRVLFLPLRAHDLATNGCINHGLILNVSNEEEHFLGLDVKLNSTTIEHVVEARRNTSQVYKKCEKKELRKYRSEFVRKLRVLNSIMTLSCPGQI